MSRPRGSRNKAKKNVQDKATSKPNTIPIKYSLDQEVAELSQVISIFRNWSDEQKQRNLKYLCAKFYDFL